MHGQRTGDGPSHGPSFQRLTDELLGLIHEYVAWGAPRDRSRGALLRLSYLGFLQRSTLGRSLARAVAQRFQPDIGEPERIQPVQGA